MAEKVCRELNVTHLLCNEFIFKDGKLAGLKPHVRGNKGILIKELIKKVGADYTLALSDGITDLDMLDIADCGMLIKDHAFKGFEMVLNGLSSGLPEKGTRL